MAGLTLAAFATRQDEENTTLVLTVTGPASKVPADVTSKAGKKGTRTIELTDGQHDALYAVGKVLTVPENGEVKLAEDGDEEWLTWFKAFVPEANGGVFKPEGSEPEEEEGAEAEAGTESDGGEEGAEPEADEKPVKGKKAKGEEPIKAAGKGKGGKKAKGEKKEPAKPSSGLTAPKYERENREDFGPEFAPGKTARVEYNHRGIGVCQYGVKREKDGTFTLVEFKGDRSGLKKGMTWPNAYTMLEALVGRPNHHVPLRRWFGLDKPPARKKAAK